MLLEIIKTTSKNDYHLQATSKDNVIHFDMFIIGKNGERDYKYQLVKDNYTYEALKKMGNELLDKWIKEYENVNN